MKHLRIHSSRAFVPLFHRHPADGLFRPDIEPERFEYILFARILLRGFTGFLDSGFLECDAHGRIGFAPGCGVCPVILRVGGIHDRVDRRVGFPSVQDVLGLLEQFITDGVDVVTRRRNDELKGLLSSIAAALGQDIVEVRIFLDVNLIYDHAVGRHTMRPVSIGG